MLALVDVIARQTAASDMESFLEKFRQRIGSLAASHEMLISSHWNGVNVAELIQRQIAYFSGLIGNRIFLEGPALLVTPSATQAIAMAIHELATNAAKYGALANDSGEVTVHWRVDDSQFSLAWVEKGGPAVSKPAAQGFGSVVTTSMIEYSFGGKAAIEYGTKGISWTMTCDLAAIIPNG